MAIRPLILRIFYLRLKFGKDAELLRPENIKNKRVQSVSEQYKRVIEESFYRYIKTELQKLSASAVIILKI